MRAPLRHSPVFWLCAFLGWFATLWLLSSFSTENEGLPQVQHIDKVAHFGYFFGGGGLLAAWIFRRNPECLSWSRLVLTTTLILAAVGALDEYHQSFTPGRSGNDVFDWMADVSGALCGATVFRAVHHWIK